MTTKAHIFLGTGQLFSRRDTNLQVDQIESGDQLGHGMLHLQACVHLEEIEILLLVNQELDGTSICIVRGSRHPNRDLAHTAPHLGIDDRRRRFFQHLLMATLQRTLALPQVNRMTMLVGQNLHFNVPRIDDRFFDVHFVIAERALGFAPRRLQG